MKRLHAFELEDQRWLPAAIRDAATDYLRFVLEAAGVYQPIIPRLKGALEETGSTEILDLCSGGAGPIVALHPFLVQPGRDLRITLSDKYPNRSTFEYAKTRSHGAVDFQEESIDATKVPAGLPGFRTLFTSLHHFRPEMARRILRDAVDQRRPIAFFDMRARRPPPLRMMLLSNPLAVLLATPFIRPFRWSRLFWTYVVPVAPLLLAWDGFASGFRLYSTEELQALVDGLEPGDYIREVGRQGEGHSITYLIGRPGPVAT